MSWVLKLHPAKFNLEGFLTDLIPVMESGAPHSRRKPLFKMFVVTGHKAKKICYPRIVTHTEFSYRGTEYRRAGTVIHASSVFNVVRSTARSPELTRYS
jgi:hypothetical protein